LLAPECAATMDFWRKYYVKMLFPVFLGVLFGLAAMMKILRWKDTGINSKLSFVKKQVFSLLTFVIIGFYTFLIQTSILPFKCVLQENGKYVMSKDPSQICYESQWISHLPGVLTFLVLYGLIFPLTIAILFYRNRHNLDESHFRIRLGNLVAPYQRRFFFWELVIILRRTAFILSIDLLSQSSSYAIKYSVATILLLSFAWTDVQLMPYATKPFNVFAIS
jgi:hypothetical protein